MKKSLSFLLLTFLFQTGYPQKEQQDYSEAFELVDVWLEAQKDFEELPGITASVVQDQDVLWEGSFGKANLEKNVPAKPNTLFSICSISKLFTSVAIMKLYDEGKIRLDDKISDILPWYDLEQKYPESAPSPSAAFLLIPRDCRARPISPIGPVQISRFRQQKK